jgi:quinol monooxygenase YgiN
MSVVVVATVQPVPEHRASVIAAFEDTIARVHGEDGCELYALHEGRDRLVMIEKWASKEALAAHGKSPALAELTSRLEGKITGGLDVQILQPHPAGKPELGVL